MKIRNMKCNGDQTFAEVITSATADRTLGVDIHVPGRLSKKELNAALKACRGDILRAATTPMLYGRCWLWEEGEGEAGVVVKKFLSPHPFPAPPSDEQELRVEPCSRIGDGEAGDGPRAMAPRLTLSRERKRDTGYGLGATE